MSLVFLLFLRIALSALTNQLHLKSTILVATVIGAHRSHVLPSHELHEMGSALLALASVPGDFSTVLRAYSHYIHIIGQVEIDSTNSFYRIALDLADSDAKLKMRRKSFDQGKRIFLGLLGDVKSQLVKYLERVKALDLLQDDSTEFSETVERMMIALEAFREINSRLCIHGIKGDQKTSLESRFRDFEASDAALRIQFDRITGIKIREWAVEQPYPTFPLLLWSYSRVSLLALESISTSVELALRGDLAAYTPTALHLYRGLLFAAVDATQALVVGDATRKTDLRDWARLTRTAWDNHKASVELATERSQMMNHKGYGKWTSTLNLVKSFRKDKIAVVRNLMILNAIVYY